MSAARATRFALAATVLLASRVAAAWDPATTHAGMTDRALAASSFHAVLAHQMGRALGAFEPVRLHPGVLDADSARSLASRLDELDPAGGYRPGGDGVLTAVGWAKAGAVLAKTPPERGRNHFLLPETGSGLDDGPGLDGTLHAARLTLGSGATVRDAATGLAFDLEGMPATEWLQAPLNDLGLPAFWDAWQMAVSARSPSERETALVRALLALGGVMSVLEDMGEPAFVRNDFRAAFPSAGSPFEDFVADRYGAVALPRATSPVERGDVTSFFVAGDGKGLAQATQRRFFSAGTLPPDFGCVPGDVPGDATALVNRSLKLPQPSLDTLDLQASERVRYVIQGGIRIAAYRRVGDTIHFFFDRTVYADVAEAWLPQVMGYAAGLADYLLRGKLQITVAGEQATVALSGIKGTAAADTVVHLLGEDDSGMRRELGVASLHGQSAVTLAVPRGTRRLAAFARGRDAGGTFVATGEATLP